MISDSITHRPNLSDYRRSSNRAKLVSGTLEWRTIETGDVEISIMVENRSAVRTLPDELIVEAAPLGAFVRHRPVGRVIIGALSPFERRKTQVVVPWSQLMKVVDRPKDNPNQGEWWARQDKTVVFLGNFNVYLEGTPDEQIERHTSFGLMVPVNVRLLNRFVVDAPDAILSVKSSDPEWRTAMTDTRELFLTVDTPKEVGRKALIIVEVTSPSARRTVPIEFDFETVAREGQTVGCVRV